MQQFSISYHVIYFSLVFHETIWDILSNNLSKLGPAVLKTTLHITD